VKNRAQKLLRRALSEGARKQHRAEIKALRADADEHWAKYHIERAGRVVDNGPIYMVMSGPNAGQVVGQGPPICQRIFTSRETQDQRACGEPATFEAYGDTLLCDDCLHEVFEDEPRELFDAYVRKLSHDGKAWPLCHEKDRW
jgi:hypothetical protein